MGKSRQGIKHLSTSLPPHTHRHTHMWTPIGLTSFAFAVAATRHGYGCRRCLVDAALPTARTLSGSALQCVRSPSDYTRARCCLSRRRWMQRQATHLQARAGRDAHCDADGSDADVEVNWGARCDWQQQQQQQVSLRLSVCVWVCVGVCVRACAFVYMCAWPWTCYAYYALSLSLPLPHPFAFETLTLSLSSSHSLTLSLSLSHSFTHTLPRTRSPSNPKLAWQLRSFINCDASGQKSTVRTVTAHAGRGCSANRIDANALHTAHKTRG